MGKAERIEDKWITKSIGIELELITGKFKQKMEEIKSSFSSLSDKKVNLSANTAQIEYLKKQIGELTADLQVNAKTPFWNENETLKAEAQLERLTNQYNKLIGKQNEVSAAITKSSNNINKGLSKMTSKVKRFGLALLSIRSIYALVSRASSAYLAQDTELANKLQAAWIGLGAILAPIINFIATLILKLVSIINGFIKALTGVDLIAKATAKSMKSAAGGANALKKALAGFDELQNLDDSSGAGAAGGFGLGDAFATVDEDFEKSMNSMLKTIDDAYKKQRNKMIKNITKMKVIMKMSGFSDDFIYMYDVAVKGAVEVIDGFVDTFQGILKIITGALTNNEEQMTEGLRQFGNGILKIIAGVGMMILGVITSLLIAIRDDIVKIATSVWDFIYNINKKAFDWIVGVITNVWNFIYSINKKAWDWTVQTASNALNSIITILNNVKNWINTKFIQPVANFFANLWNAILTKFKNSWNKIANAVNKVGTKLGITLPIINSYAVGTNYVPEDQLAMVHKGEAIIPKKFNSEEYFGGTNDETNALLKELISKVEGIEINPYTTIKDVGKASLNYINAKSRQLGESVVV